MPPKFISNSRLGPSRSDMPHPINNLHHRPTLPPQHQQERVMLGPDAALSPRNREDRLPHDASVFVGSLPSNIDQADLTRMLMTHLSEHTEIKNIKVVRDSKGGVCAFVQCENAASATRLIQTLHSTAPKPFLGRTLRYEPARAFRTLLVSYRTPTQPVRQPSLEKTAPSDMRLVEMELELPHAIRICKHKSSRFHTIVYNVEAIDTENACGLPNPTLTTTDHILFMEPLQFSKEALQKMASYFGKLESFLPFQPNKPEEHIHNQSGHLDPILPFPHNSPRSSNMDPLCWEIKWEHRDDCVSALMTLRRIPHLTVTWAHQPSSSTGPVFTHRYNPKISFPPYPATRLPLNHHLMQGSFHNRSKPIHVLPFQRQRFEEHVPEQSINPQSSETEFAASATITETPKLDRSEISRQQTQTPISDTLPSPASTAGHNATRLASNPGMSSNVLSEVSQSDDSQELLYMPDTPSLDTSSVTPITPGSQYPITPRTIPAAGSPKDAFPPAGDVFNETQQHERVTDPTTLFVGGLELFGPAAWNEEKLRSFFSRFGGLESVKVVRPINSCAGFAFVKFDNVESPARAVSEEHNRVHEGRTMRVQLRECNPTRNNWRPGRGRGRFFHNPMSFQRRFMKPAFERPLLPPIKGHDKAGGFLTDNYGGNHLSSPSIDSLSETAIPSSAPVPGMRDMLAGASPSQLPDEEPETYREWYDELDSPTHTPAPSSLGSSASVTGASLSGSAYQAPYANAAFYPSVPWAHPPLISGAYQMPYFGPYPSYNSHPAHSQRLITPPASEASGPSATSRQSWPHSGVYPPYLPYPVFPFRPTAEATAHLHVNPQAPLVPTGFMQNEQGTLIAVYQPEALDQYLAASGVSSAQTPHAQQMINVPRFGAPSTLSLHHPVYESNNHTSTTASDPQTTAQHRARNHTMFPFTPPPQLANYQRPSISFRGYDGTTSISAPLYRRQGAKTDFVASQQPAQWNGSTAFGHPPRIHGPGGNNHYPDPSP